MKQPRADRGGANRTSFEKNKKILRAMQNPCALCGQPIDYSLPADNPMSFEADHIIPIKLGGHPSDLANLQATHKICNRQKGAKLRIASFKEANPDNTNTINNRILPQSTNWKQYRYKG